MQLAELQQQARQILELTTDKEETNAFIVKSGGRPIDNVGVKDFIIHQSSDFKYKTQMCGRAYESETVIQCTNTQTKDGKGRTIYLLPNGETFVWDYVGGSAMNFDRGYFEHPCLN